MIRPVFVTKGRLVKRQNWRSQRANLERRLPPARGRFAELHRVLEEIVGVPLGTWRPAPSPYDAWGEKDDDANRDVPSERDSANDEDMMSNADRDDVDAVLDALQGHAQGPDRLGELILPPDDADFDPSVIETHVSRERMTALLDGAQPNSAELALWRERQIEDVDACDIRWHVVTLWAGRDESGHPVVWANVHEDGGTYWHRVGPCATISEVEDALAELGRLQWE